MMTENIFDIERLQDAARWTEFKSANPHLKSRIVEGLPDNKDNEIIYGVRFFLKNKKQYAEILYKECL